MPYSILESSSNKLNEHGMPIDQYGRLVGADRQTDPYGKMKWVIGDTKDCMCFDYKFFKHNGNNCFVLEIVCDSESGSFTNSACYKVVDEGTCKAGGDFEILVGRSVINAIENAMEWLINGVDKVIRHNKKNYEQDCCYLLRSVALDLSNMYNYGFDCSNVSDRQLRYGGKYIDTITSIIFNMKFPLQQKKTQKKTP